MKLHSLLSVIPKSEIKRVLNQDYCELNEEFLGFTDIYENLAKIIPLHYTIIDLGCYCAAQAYYFTQHKTYIGLDVFNGLRFNTNNSQHYTKSIQKFIEEDLHIFDLDETFAICSYIPDEDAKNKIRKSFINLFVYYPSDKNNNWINKRTD